MIYTFGIVSYNQENDILRALESIKYQVIHFGKDLKIEVIVADDSSSDKTVSIAEKWLEDNEQLFWNYQVISASKNEGT